MKMDRDFEMFNIADPGSGFFTHWIVAFTASRAALAISRLEKGMGVIYFLNFAREGIIVS